MHTNKQTDRHTHTICDAIHAIEVVDESNHKYNLKYLTKHKQSEMFENAMDFDL